MKPNIIFCFLILLVFVSCEYEGPIIYQIENLSDYSIDVVYNIGGSDSAKIIESQSLMIMHVEEGFNGMMDYGDRFLKLAAIDTIHFIVPDTVDLVQNPMNRESWEYSTRPYNYSLQPLAGENIYTYKIINEDISNNCESIGEITGVDVTRCACCGGWKIKIDDDIFLTDSIPNRLEILGSERIIEYPILIYLDYIPANYCSNRIVITCIRKRN